MNMENKNLMKTQVQKKNAVSKKMSTQCVGILPACKENWQFKTQFSSVQSLYVIPQRKSFFKSFPFSREDNQRKALHCIAAVEKHNLKSDNLQYNTLVCWVVGTNDSSTKRLMF